MSAWSPFEAMSSAFSASTSASFFRGCSFEAVVRSVSIASSKTRRYVYWLWPFGFRTSPFWMGLRFSGFGMDHFQVVSRRKHLNGEGPGRLGAEDDRGRSHPRAWRSQGRRGEGDARRRLWRLLPCPLSVVKPVPSHLR